MATHIFDFEKVSRKTVCLLLGLKILNRMNLI